MWAGGGYAKILQCQNPLPKPDRQPVGANYETLRAGLAENGGRVIVQDEKKPVLFCKEILSRSEIRE